MGNQEGVHDPLWITRLARVSGVTGLITRVGRPQLAPYLFILSVVFIDTAVLSTVGYLAADRLHPLLESAFWYIAPIGLVFCVWVIRMFASEYEGLVKSYDSTEFEADDLDGGALYDIRRTRLKHVILVLLLGVHVFNYIIRGGWTAVVEMEGPIIGFIKYAIIIPFGYFPLIAEIAGITVACFVLIPRHFIDNQYILDFEDPLNIGGLEAVGDLIKRAFYVYSTGLLILLAWVYGPSLFSSVVYVAYGPPGWFETLQFTVAWVVGLALLLYGVYSLHRYMQRRKRAKIDTIDKRIRKLGDNDRRIPGPDINDREKTELEILHLELEEVRMTRTWPFSTEAQERIIFSAILPLLAERVLVFLTSFQG